MHTPTNDTDIRQSADTHPLAPSRLRLQPPPADAPRSVRPAPPWPQTLLTLLAALVFLFGTGPAGWAREANEAPRGHDDLPAHLDALALSDGSYHYTITLTNAGSDNIGTFWFAWVPGKSFLPTSPTNLQSPANWTAKITRDGATDGYAIQWTVTSTAATTALLKPGQSFTFTFNSTDTPATLQAASSLYPGFAVTTSFAYRGAPFSDPGVQFVVAGGPSSFFKGNDDLGGGIRFLTCADGTAFGYFSYLSDDHYIYHQDLGFEYVFDAADGNGGMYLYDFASDSFFYTSSGTGLTFPYLYDFKLGSVVYYYPDPNPEHKGRYNTDGVRYFYEFKTGETIHK